MTLMIFHVFFIIIQAISVLIMMLFIHEYKRIAKQHEELIIAIEHGKTPCCKQQSTVIIWIYIISTCVLLVSTVGLYFSIPALF